MNEGLAEEAPRSRRTPKSAAKALSNMSKPPKTSKTAQKLAVSPTPKTALRTIEEWEQPRPTQKRERTIGPARHDAAGHGMMTYFQELRQHPLLSRDEEQSIALELTRTGDPELAQKLVAANLRLVVKIALEYRTARHNLLDLVQEGNLGLLHAVRKFDPTRAVKLATYASWWIRAYILKFILSNARLVKLGTTQAQRRLFFGLGRETARLGGHDGAPVEAHQLAATFAVSEKEVVEMERRLSAGDASLDAPTRVNDDERTLGDGMQADPASCPDVLTERSEFNAAVGREVRVFAETLSGRDEEIFHARLLCDEPTTLAEIATRFGVSRERVRQLEERLKLRLQRHLRAALGDAVPRPASPGPAAGKRSGGGSSVRSEATVDEEDEPDDIEEAGRGSFPASDAPPWTLGIEPADHHA